MKKRNLVLLTAITVCLVMICTVLGSAASYPDKPIKIIVTKSLGGSVDSAIRLFQPYLEKELGVPIVIQNMTAGGGRVAADEVFKAKPDGYTLLVAPLPSAIVGQLLYKVEHDFKEFVPVFNTMLTYQTITVSAKSEIYTFDDLVKLSQSKRITMAGSGGMGSNASLVHLKLRELALKDLTLVPYPGAPESAAAIMGGDCDISSQSSSGVLSYVREGTLRVIAICGNERVKELPDVPTLKELGYDINVPLTSSVFAPPGTSPEIIKILENAFSKAVNYSDFEIMRAKMDVALYPANSEKLGQIVNSNFELVESVLPMLQTK